MTGRHSQKRPTNEVELWADSLGARTRHGTRISRQHSSTSWRGRKTNRCTCVFKRDFLPPVIPGPLCGYWISISRSERTPVRLRRTFIGRALTLLSETWMPPFVHSRRHLPERTHFRIFGLGPFTSCRFSSPLSA